MESKYSTKKVLVFLAASALLTSTSTIQAADPTRPLPITGAIRPEGQIFEDTLLEYIAARNIPAASMVISKNGKWLVNRSYGYKDQEKTTPLGTSPMFRIASLVKPITAALIYDLESEGKISLEAPLFLDNNPDPDSDSNSISISISDSRTNTEGYLDLNRFFPNGIPGSFPEEIRTITIDQVLQHKGGWDRSISGDPVFMSKKISEDLQLTELPTQEEIVRWTLSRPLDFQPGARRAYSNFGFLLLGLVIEEITGSDYVAWAQQKMKDKCGIELSQIALARTFTEDRDCREPWYSHPGEELSILDYLTPIPYPDGAFHIEIMEAHGGLIMSPQAYMKFLEHYWISGRPRDNTNQNWTFFGSLPGTYTLGRQNNDGWNFVVFFNQRKDENFNDYSDIRIILDEISEKISASADPSKI